jgi:exodeoxyribonuclease VIII
MEYPLNELLAGIPNADYHAAPGIGKSGLDLINRSPAHFRYAPSREPSRNMVLGSATHAAILEPDTFARDYVIVDCADKRASIWKEAVAARGADAVLTRAESDQIAGMAESCRSNPAIASILAAGRAELSLFATDPVTGVRVKIRPDWLTDAGQIADLKTTADASDEGFGKSIVNYRYYVQQAFYQDVFSWAFGDVPDFVFLVCESEMPHCSTIVRLPHDVLQYGRKVYRENLNAYARALESDEWHGIPSDEHVIMLPGWFIGQIENEQEINV